MNPSNAKYPFALAADKKTAVHISEATRGEYYCPDCLRHGREARMVVALGEKNIHHFRHKSTESEGACRGESQTHIAGKRKFRERFFSNIGVSLYDVEGLWSSCICLRGSECAFGTAGCSIVRKTRKIVEDIRMYSGDPRWKMTECKEEERVWDATGGRWFVADLLLTGDDGSPEPILVEIKNTHACSDEKLRSGLRILEIEVLPDGEFRRGVKAYGFLSSINGCGEFITPEEKERRDVEEARKKREEEYACRKKKIKAALSYRRAGFAERARELERHRIWAMKEERRKIALYVAARKAELKRQRYERKKREAEETLDALWAARLAKAQSWWKQGRPISEEESRLRVAWKEKGWPPSGDTKESMIEETKKIWGSLKQ